MKYSSDETAIDIEVMVVDCSVVVRHALIICTYFLTMTGAINSVENQQRVLGKTNRLLL
jgi:hypothetical protein